MGGKTRITRRERREGREEAARRLDDIGEHVTEVRRNDEIGSHYTIWLTPADRAEWWPGARHWRVGSDDHHGDVDDLIEWLKR